MSPDLLLIYCKQNYKSQSKQLINQPFLKNPLFLIDGTVAPAQKYSDTKLYKSLELILIFYFLFFGSSRLTFCNEPNIKSSSIIIIPTVCTAQIYVRSSTTNFELKKKRKSREIIFFKQWNYYYFILKMYNIKMQI